MPNTVIPNPLRKCYVSFLNQISITDGLLRQLESAFKGFHKRLRTLENSTDINKFISGSRVTFLDLTEEEKEVTTDFLSAPRFIVRGKEYFSVFDDLIFRNSGWTILNSYESFETFIKDLIALYLNANPTEAKKEASQKFSRKFPVKNLDYWKNYSRKYYRNNKEALKFIRTLSNRIEPIEQKNHRELNLSDWFLVISKVRHAITHSNFVVKSDVYCSLSIYQRRILRGYFSGRKIVNSYSLEITPYDAHRAIEILSQYAHLIFKCLSLAKNYDTDLSPE
jgi:hypothetical protein